MCHSAKKNGLSKYNFQRYLIKTSKCTNCWIKVARMKIILNGILTKFCWQMDQSKVHVKRLKMGISFKLTLNLVMKITRIWIMRVSPVRPEYFLKEKMETFSVYPLITQKKPEKNKVKGSFSKIPLSKISLPPLLLLLRILIILFRKISLQRIKYLILINSKKN